MLLALAVVAVWGTNFVVIKQVRCTCRRFCLRYCDSRWLFFLPRPALSWRNLAQYGLLIGVGQFGLLFIAMHGHISPGLASLVIQVQAFFTIFLSMRLTGERVRPMQWLALAVATAGLVVIATHADGSTTPFGLLLVVIAAACCASSNWRGAN